MAKLGDVVNILIAGAKSFVTTSLFRERCDERAMTTENTTEFLSVYLDTIDEQFDTEVRDALRGYIEKYAPTAKTSIYKNKHMNKANGSYRSDQNLLAVLVDFVNFAAIPMDLALYTSDILLIVPPAVSYPLTVELTPQIVEEVKTRISKEDPEPEYKRQVHERAWLDIAQRLAGSPPPFVPYDGDSSNLDENDRERLTEFFLNAKTRLFWCTGIDHLDACDNIVIGARNNANFNEAYALWSLTKFTKAAERKAAKVIPAWGTEKINVRGSYR